MTSAENPGDEKLPAANWLSKPRDKVLALRNEVGKVKKGMTSVPGTRLEWSG